MLVEERKHRILNLLRLNNIVKVAELSELFETSEVTVRKDLQDLENEGKLKRIHGGAITDLDTGFEPAMDILEKKHVEEKKKIAQKALEYISDNDAIILDGSSTVKELAKLIASSNLRGVTIVTTSMRSAEILLSNDNIEVIIIGGKIRKNTFSIVGPIAERNINNLKFDKAFLGTNGIDIEYGFSTPTFAVSEVKKAIIKSAKQSFVLSDRSKINKTTLGKICDISEVDYLIIDDGISGSYVNCLKETGIQVVIAK